LQAAGDQVRKSRSYFTGSLIVFFPLLVVLLLVISTFVVPKFKAIGAEMLETVPSNWTLTHIDQIVSLSLIPIALLGLILISLAAGPRIRLFLLGWLPPTLIDRCANWAPWNNRRLRRDFSLTLAMLLDAGVPEEQALRHAGSATGSHFFQRLAARAAASLQHGARFLDALALVDHAGELRWRWQIAARAQLPFQHALEGWHETLNVRAVKAEQSAASLTTSILILLNGLVVGSVVLGVFQFLTTIIEETALW
jgi:type II secretory pathway component PulF